MSARRPPAGRAAPERKPAQTTPERPLAPPKHRVPPRSAAGFDYTLEFTRVDFRKNPELYRIGKGEQGVLLVQPYKGELLPHWRFRTPDVARASAATLYGMFRAYAATGDFVGMDMARKFIQMGWTRSLRYYHHKSGKKYVGPVPDDRKGQSGAHGRAVAPLDTDDEKLACAAAFRERLDEVLADEGYRAACEEHRARYRKSSTTQPPGATPATSETGAIPNKR